MSENPRAFPSHHHPGMTLRDWFAGREPGVLGVNQITVVEACYSMADAMLKERQK